MQLSNFTPTPFDHSPSVFFDHDDPRRGWHMMPVMINRDTPPGSHEMSNWCVVKNHLESIGYTESWEVHRFGHWACGWFEIIIFDPQCAPVRAYAETIQKHLENFPVLDEVDLAEREYAQRFEDWEGYGQFDAVCHFRAMICTDDEAEHDRQEAIVEWLESLSAEESYRVLDEHGFFSEVFTEGGGTYFYYNPSFTLTDLNIARVWWEAQNA